MSIEALLKFGFGLISGLKEYIHQLTLVIRLKNRFQKKDKNTIHKSIEIAIKTILIRAVDNSVLTDEQKKQFEESEDIQQLIREWLINNIDYKTIAKKVDYSRWQLSGDIGDSLERFLLKLAEETSIYRNEHLPLDIQMLRREVAAVPEKTINSVYQTNFQTQLSEIENLIKVGKVRTALSKATQLSQLCIPLLNQDDFILKVLEKIFICHQRLICSIDRHDILSNLYKIKDYIKNDNWRLKKINAIIAHYQDKDAEAIKILKELLELRPSDANCYIFMHQLLIKNDQLEDAKKLIDKIEPKIIENDLCGFADCYFNAHDLERADELICKHNENNDIDAISSILRTHIHLQRISFNRDPKKIKITVTPNLIKELKLRLDVIKSCISDEDESNLYQFYILQGTYYYYIQDTYQAEIFYSKAYDISKNDSDLLSKFVAMLYINKRYQEALVVLQHFDSINEKKHIWENLLLLELGEVDKVLANIDKLLSDTTISRLYTVRLTELKMQALIKLIRIDEAELLVNNLYKTHSDIAYTYNVKAAFLRQVGKTQEAIECLRDLLTTVNNGDEQTSVFLKIDLFFLLLDSEYEDDLSLAIELGEQLFGPDHPDNNFVSYLRLLYNMRLFDKCLELCHRVEAQHNFISMVKDVEALTLLYHEEFIASAEIWQKILLLNPNNTNALYHLCHCYYRLSRYEDALKVIQLAQKYMRNDIGFIRIASEVYKKCYSVTNNPDHLLHSIKYAHKALEVSNNSQEVVEYYIFLILLYTNKCLHLIPQDYIEKSKQLIESYPVSFPNGKALQMHKVPADPDELLKFVINNFSQDVSHYNNIFDTYNKHHFPLYFLASAFNRDIFTTWNFITQSPNTNFWLTDADLRDVRLEDGVILKYDKIVISLSSLFLLAKFDLLNMLFNIFNVVYITQSTFDAISNLRSDIFTSLEDGSQSLLVENGNVHFIKTEREVYQQQGVFFDTIITFIKSRCQIVGSLILQVKPPVEKVTTVLGNENIQFTFSQNSELLYYSDEWFVRNYSRLNGKTETTYILPFLRLCRQRNIISIEKYADILADIINSNYDKIPIETSMLFASINAANFTLTVTVKTLLNNLSQPFWKIDGVIDILLQTLRYVWLNANTIQSKEIFTDYIISILIKILSLTRTVELLKKNINFIVSPLNPLNQDHLISILLNYKRNATIYL